MPRAPGGPGAPCRGPRRTTDDGDIARRKLILRILLGSLGAAAVAGVLAVLLPIDEVVLRVMLTGCTTAVAAGIALPLSMLLDRTSRRPAGLLGIAVLVIEFLLALVLIWLEGPLSWRLQEHFAFTMVFLFLVGVPALVFMLMAQSVRARVAGIAGLVVSAATVACLLFATWDPRTRYLNDEWAGTGGLIGLFGAIAVFMLTDFGTGRLRPPPLWLRVAGMMGAAGAMIVTLVDIWHGPDNDSLASLTISLGAVVALVTLLHLANLEGRQRWIRNAAIAGGVATAVLVNLLVFTDGDFAEEAFERATAATGIVTACASMAVLVLIALNRRVDVDRRTAALLELGIVCPRCRKKQTITVGDSRCSACGLGITIHIEEPCCPQCGYTLYGLESSRCPECGTSIAAEPTAPDPDP